MGDNVITTDVLCSRCGYNLRGLARRGKCPECGRALARSLLDRPEWAGHLAWQRCVRSGLALVTVGLAWTVMMMLSLPVLAVAAESMSVTAWWLIATGVWIVGPTVVTAIGMWRVGTLEPGGVWDDRSRVIALMLRGLTVLRTAAWAAVAVLVVPMRMDAAPPWLMNMSLALPGAGLLTGLLIFIELQSWLCYILRVLRLHREASGGDSAVGWIGLALIGALVVIAMTGALLGNELLIGLPLTAMVVVIVTMVAVPTAMLWHALHRMAREAA